MEKQAKVIKKSETKIQAMMPNILQAFILIDKEYRIIAFNKVADQLFKNFLSIPFTTGMHFNKLLPENLFNGFAGDFKKAMRGAIVSSERILTGKKGKSLTFLVNFTPVIEPGSAIELISLSLLDITELKTLKNELNKSEKLIDSVFQTADIGIAMVDQEGKFVKVNDGFSKLLKYGKNELDGKPYLKIIPAAERKEATKMQKDLLQNKIKNIERKIVCKDGTIIDSYITNKVLIDEEGRKYLIKTIRDITETKRYKGLLETTEKAVHAGGYVLDVLSGQIIWTNELYDIYELDKTRNLTIEKVLSFCVPEAAPKFRKAMQDAIAKGRPFEIELEIIAGKKTKKWLNITGKPVRLKSKTISILGTKQDITKKKKVEQERERLSLVASHANNIVIITDKDGKIEWVNKSFESRMGYALKEVMGRRPGDFLQGPGTDQRVVKKIGRRLARKQRCSGEVLLNYTKEGQPIWITLDITPIEHDGDLISFVGVMTDLTELMKAKEMQREQEALKKSKQLLENMAINFPDGIIGVLDQDFNYVFAGGTEIKRLGLTPAHLVGRHMFDSLSEKSNVAVEPFLQKAFAGKNVLFEVTLKSYIFAVNAVPLFYKGQKVQQVLVVLNNITQRRKAEEEVFQALARQRELNELKSRFISIASHEFRTPLSGILSSVYLITQYNAIDNNEKIQKHIERISSSVHLLTDILNDFLSLGRIEEGKIMNNVTEFDLVEFCEKLVSELQTLAKKDQTLQYSHQGDQRTVALDRPNLRHVLSNLLSNASKYSGEGQDIKLATSITGRQVKFVIKDSGIGIPDEDQPNLFQTFFRANNTSGIQGTGLGLHIVKRYLDVMGGTIEFKSRLNEGSEFTVYLPAAPAE